MTIATKRQYLSHLVEQKNKWFRPLLDEEKRLGFLGWHERGYLPHCDYPGLVQLVTFRLADSMPESKRGDWELLLRIEDNREKRAQLENYLDRGHGSCLLREGKVAQCVERSLLHFHRQRYELLAWCIMPNHVHVLVHVWDMPLSKMIQSWKRFSASAAVPQCRPPVRCVPGSFWEREYWDTYMRDEEQEKTAVRYIENNPVKARLCRTSEFWLASSAHFRDRHNALRLPLTQDVPNRSSALRNADR